MAVVAIRTMTIKDICIQRAGIVVDQGLRMGRSLYFLPNRQW
jgi:hypothetical protein